jgi:REP element-mobilizing transposase RayT
MKTILKRNKSTQQELGKIYLWTAAIHKWKSLLYFEEQKEMIVNSLRHLHEKKLVTIYAYVIMPNHIHIIWKQHKKNGKEMPRNSFLKHTARELLKKVNDYGKNSNFKVLASNKKHQIWQPDSYALELYSKKFIVQKLKYIHELPTKGRWKQCIQETDYKYCSANFYSSGFDHTRLLNNILSNTKKIAAS